LLTDLHVHLRPDDLEATEERYFTAENARRYRDTARERGIEQLGVSEHVYRFRQALEVWDHEFWQQNAVGDLDEYCEFVRGETDLLLGIEADYFEGREERVAALLDSRDWDYVIGSIHFMRGGALDHEDYDVWQPGADPDEVWERYFDTLAGAARSGLFDVLAHPDLVKMWGSSRPRPDGDLRRFYDRAMGAIADADVAIEVSTAGLRKPVGEIYPAPDFLRMCVDAGKPLALSSDAHTPEQLGHAYPEAIDLLRGLGVDEIATFERRERRMVPLA
jgi:histidinol-phosphatase (PHP family)